MRAYLSLLGIRGVKPLLFVSTFGRLAYSMVSLAIYFQVLDVTASVGLAGVAVGVSAALSSLTAGPRGLIVDRFGQTRPLFVFVPAYAVSCLMLATLGQGAVVAIILSGLIGLTAPPINISIRPLWLDIVGGERVRVAYSLDTAYSSLVLLLGPVVATLVALHWSPQMAIAFVGLSMLVGGLLLAFNTHSRAWIPESRQVGEHGLLRSPAMHLLAVAGAAMGLSAGFITIGIPAVATLSGEQEAIGPVMSAMGVGAVIGTVWAGAKAKTIAPANGLRTSTLLFGLALLPLPFVPIGPWMMLVVLVSWAFIGPANVFYLETIDVVRPRGTAVAALGSLWMIEGAAAAVGNAVGGSVAVQVSPMTTLALGCLFGLLAPIVFTVGIHGVLRPASATELNRSADD